MKVLLVLTSWSQASCFDLLWAYNPMNIIYPTGKTAQDTSWTPCYLPTGQTDQWITLWTSEDRVFALRRRFPGGSSLTEWGDRTGWAWYDGRGKDTEKMIVTRIQGLKKNQANMKQKVNSLVAIIQWGDKGWVSKSMSDFIDPTKNHDTAPP